MAIARTFENAEQTWQGEEGCAPLSRRDLGPYLKADQQEEPIP